jgi:cellulose synthase/poly-beta-1,6-N-acetylglucosamine synthase-like glycosyltransferase
MGEIILFALVFLVVYVYAGYPFLLWVIGAFQKRPTQKAAFYPSISILIAAHNEARNIRETIENKLGLNYPAEKLEVIVVSDASMDGTDDIVKRMSARNVHLLRQEPRQGKTAALNLAAARAEGEILVFSDANSLYQEDALKELMTNFADPQVGYVTGRMEYVTAKDSCIGDGTSGYMSYENWLRELETAVGSIVGVDGGIDAVRKSLYSPMDPSLLPDLILPLGVVEKGYRVIYEPNAVLHEEALDESEKEYEMRIRVALRAFHAIWHKRALLNPFRYGLYPLKLLSHKLLRYLVGYFLVLILLCSIIIQRPWSLLFAAAQIAVYLSAIFLLGNPPERMPRLFRYLYYFCLINFASAIAFILFLAGQKKAVWTPRQG